MDRVMANESEEEEEKKELLTWPIPRVTIGATLVCQQSDPFYLVMIDERVELVDSIITVPHIHMHASLASRQPAVKNGLFMNIQGWF